MTDTPLDLDAIEARAEAATDGPWLASHNVTEDTHDVSVLYSNGIGVLVADFHKRPDDARFAAHARTDVPALVAALRKAEAQVADVLALHTPTRVWLRSTPEPTMACGICQDPWPCITAAAVDAPAGVPMSPNPGHHLRDRIAQRIDQAWAEANDQRPRSEYRDGYLDGLEYAEAVARITPLTIGVAPLDVEAPQYDRIESRGRKS